MQGMWRGDDGVMILMMVMMTLRVMMMMMMIRPRVRAHHLPSHMFFSRVLSQGKQTSIKKKAITGLHKVSTQR